MSEKISGAKEAVGLELLARIEEIEKLRDAFLLLGGDLHPDGRPKMDGAEPPRTRFIKGLVDEMLAWLSTQKAPVHTTTIAKALYKEEYGVTAASFRLRVASNMKRLAADKSNGIKHRVDKTSELHNKPYLYWIEKKEK